MEDATATATHRWRLPSWRRWLAIIVFAMGALLLTIRFPPADAPGWIAQQLGTTHGVPLLFVAAMFIAVGFLLIGERRLRVFQYISFGAAAYIGLSGILLISTPV